MSAGALKPLSQSQPPPRASARLWLYRAFAALGIPLLLFLGLEGGLRVAGFGHPASFLMPDDQPGFFRTNPDFVGLFLPGSFDLRPLNFRVAARKPPDTVRIVVLGESAAQGIPTPAFGFAPQLRAQLRARYPEKNIEVINTGIVAINSHVVYQVARELAAFAPDMFVVYLGNNEVVGPYGPGCAYLSEMPPLWLIRLSVFVRSTRTGQAMGVILAKLAWRRGRPAEWGGMAMFVDHAVSGDDPRLEAVGRNFEANLRDIVGVAQAAGAKVLLCTLVSNLKDCPPLLSQHRAGLTAGELAAWQRAFERGRFAWLLGEGEAARADLGEALRIDPHYADTSFMLGSLELAAGEVAAARAHLVAAAHWDALRFRPDPGLNEIIRGVAAREPAVILLDAAVQMGSDPAAEVAPAGRELLFEHVHFDWEGNHRLARAMAQEVETALFGGTPGRGAWLDAAGCAAALGYTKHERFPVLQRLAAMVQHPPFTNQLTYGEDQVKLARALAEAQAEAADPANLRHAKETVRTAAAADPGNPDLAKLEEDIDDDLGDVAGALAQVRRAQQLQPRNFALFTDEAIKLSRLGRYEEAGKLLQETAQSCPPRDLVLMAPALADFFRRTRRFEEGRRYFDALVARHPAERKLRLMRGNLARWAGDAAAAEREFRALLADDPGNQSALEGLVDLLNSTGQSAAAEAAGLAAADHQPGNHANNLRAVLILESRGDEAQSLPLLLAAGRSGPVTAGMELRLVRRLGAAGRLDEALTHLAMARRISRYEGDPVVTEAIDQLIADLRGPTR